MLANNIVIIPNYQSRIHLKFHYGVRVRKIGKAAPIFKRWLLCWSMGKSVHYIVRMKSLRFIHGEYLNEEYTRERDRENKIYAHDCIRTYTYMYVYRSSVNTYACMLQITRNQLNSRDVEKSMLIWLLIQFLIR